MGGRGNSGNRNTDTSLILGNTSYKESTYYTYKEGALYRNVVAGQVLDTKRPTRVAGKYKIFVDSFPRATLPYSKFHIANTETGKVYSVESIHGTGISLKQVVEELKERK